MLEVDQGMLYSAYKNYLRAFVVQQPTLMAFSSTALFQESDERKSEAFSHQEALHENGSKISRKIFPCDVFQPTNMLNLSTLKCIHILEGLIRFTCVFQENLNSP